MLKRFHTLADIGRLELTGAVGRNGFKSHVDYQAEAVLQCFEKNFCSQDYLGPSMDFTTERT